MSTARWYHRLLGIIPKPTREELESQITKLTSDLLHAHEEYDHLELRLIKTEQQNQLFGNAICRLDDLTRQSNAMDCIAFYANIANREELHRAVDEVNYAIQSIVSNRALFEQNSETK